MATDTELLDLIATGLLPLGMSVSCGLPGVAAVVQKGGLEIGGRVFADPTAAMQAVLPGECAMGSGWLFWHLPDAGRLSVRPLEHLRVALAARSQQGQLKTSLTHPLRLDWLPIPGYAGRLGMTLCPGKQGEGLYGGCWARDLRQDLSALKEQWVAMVLTLLERHEFDLLGVPGFGAAVTAAGLEWQWREIRDSGTPDADFEAQWPALKERLRAVLASGAHVAVHCRGGLGRTGLVVARFLTQEGYAPDEAIRLVRVARPGTIETWAQEQYVRSWALNC
ncbi:MAG TPA: hypothetical protein VFM34_02265 [Moraxellaceae bacterium]|nr:hypothetical protein [Moraxellaceae bacterium]